VTNVRRRIGVIDRSGDEERLRHWC